MPDFPAGTHNQGVGSEGNISRGTGFTGPLDFPERHSKELTRFRAAKTQLGSETCGLGYASFFWLQWHLLPSGYALVNEGGSSNAFHKEKRHGKESSGPQPNRTHI